MLQWPSLWDDLRQPNKQINEHLLKKENQIPAHWWNPLANPGVDNPGPCRTTWMEERSQGLFKSLFCSWVLQSPQVWPDFFCHLLELLNPIPLLTVLVFGVQGQSPQKDPHPSPVEMGASIWISPPDLSPEVIVWAGRGRDSNIPLVVPTSCLWCF